MHGADEEPLPDFIESTLPRSTLVFTPKRHINSTLLLLLLIVLTSQRYFRSLISSLDHGQHFPPAEYIAVHSNSANQWYVSVCWASSQSWKGCQLTNQSTPLLSRLRLQPQWQIRYKLSALQVRITMRSLIGTNTCAKMFDIDFIAGCLAWLNNGRYTLFHNSPCVDIVGHVAEIYIQDKSMIFLRLDAQTSASVCSREDTAGNKACRTSNNKTTALGCELQHGCITVGPITVTETSGATDFVLAGVRCGQGIS